MIEYKVDLEGISPKMLDGFFDGWPNPPSPEKHLKLLKNSTKIVLAVDREKHAVAGLINWQEEGSGFSSIIDSGLSSLFIKGSIFIEIYLVK